jgi:hypothetical protein
MAKKTEFSSGFVRINELMISMMEAAEDGDKERLVKLSQNFAEDAEDLVGLLLMMGGVTDEDMEKILPDDTEQLIRDAASASQIRTAKVKE